MKRLLFYLGTFFKNNWYIGTVELILFTASIGTAIYWWNKSDPSVEPITIIFASVGAILDLIKRLIRSPKLHRLTFSESIAKSSRESSFFFGATLVNYRDAIKIAKKENKGIFLVIYDNEHSTKSKLDHSLGYFTQYEMTKRLINQSFIQAIVPSSDFDVKQFIPHDYHMENCLLVVIDTNNKIIRQEGVYANPDEGLKRVRLDIETMTKQNSH
jgi:hypothetical protein